jgi:serpin B
MVMGGMKPLLGFALLIMSVSSDEPGIDPALISAAWKCSAENNHFAFDLYDVLRQKKDSENMLVSPYSLRTVVAMLQAGAEGSTANEIQLGMRFPENKSELFTSYTAMRNIGNYIKRKDEKASESSTFPITVEEANRIYIRTGYPIKTSFQAILKHHFQAPLAQIDFGNSKKAAEEINNWVSDHTHQKITKVVETDALTSETRLVLVNTLYFKGPWETRFHGRSTQPAEFHMKEGNKVMVDMMNIEAHFPVVDIEALNAKVIALPYEGKRFQFLIVLPNTRFGLKEMESKLKSDSFPQIFEKLRKSQPRFVDLSMPKFTIESTFDLIETMKKLKMEELFSDQMADFRGIVEPEANETLYVNKLVQKTFLKVEEQGSEAGAATFAAVFTPLSIGPTLEENIVVDHPFMGFIYDNKMDLILFAFRKSSF